MLNLKRSSAEFDPDRTYELRVLELVPEHVKSLGYCCPIGCLRVHRVALRMTRILSLFVGPRFLRDFVLGCRVHMSTEN